MSLPSPPRDPGGAEQNPAAEPDPDSGTDRETDSGKGASGKPGASDLHTDREESEGGNGEGMNREEGANGKGMNQEEGGNDVGMSEGGGGGGGDGGLYPYILPQFFTSEIHKMELQNLPRYSSALDIKKLLARHGVRAHKVKALGRATHAFVTFASGGERDPRHRSPQRPHLEGPDTRSKGGAA
ncbi:unnamed protein product [Lampetra planeri]